MISRSLSSYINQLQYRLQEAIIYQISDDFMDITSTIKILRQAAFRPPSIHNEEFIKCKNQPAVCLVLDEPNRQERFQTAIQEFVNHSSTLTQTARLAANGTSCRSKSTIETINITASQVCSLINSFQTNIYNFQ
jgi:hypothetical protein